MTDWLPWGFAFMAGTFATAALTLRALGRTPLGQRPDLRPAWWTLLLTVLVTATLYTFYIVWGERWIWYLR